MIKIDFTNINDRDSFICSNTIGPGIKALFRYDNFTSRLGKRFLEIGVPPRYKDQITSDYSALKCLQLDLVQLLGIDRFGLTVRKIFGNFALIYIYSQDIVDGLLGKPSHTWRGVQPMFYSYPHVTRCNLCLKPTHVGQHESLMTHLARCGDTYELVGLHFFFCLFYNLLCHY